MILSATLGAVHRSYAFVKTQPTKYSRNTIQVASAWLSRFQYQCQQCLLATGLCGAVFLSGMQPLFAQEDRIQLPDLGASADAIFSDGEERSYARQLIYQLRQFGLLIEDPQVNEFFSDMGYRLISHSDEPDRPYHFVVLNEPNINAFAAPGGVIALHSGMILVADEESEIAGVLAHEIVHVTQNHLERSFEEARKLSIPLALLAVGLIAVGGVGAIAPALLGTQGLSAQSQINFTRQNEYEADRLGIQILVAANYNPHAMASMFAKLGRASRNFAIRVPEYLRTHPITTTRIAEAKNRADNLPPGRYIEDIDFFLMQARIRALVSQFPQDAIKYFREELAMGNHRFPDASRYGLVLALQQASRFEDADRIIDGLLETAPRKLAYQIEKAHIDIGLGNQQAAMDRFALLYQQYSGNRILARYYAEALLTANQPIMALDALNILRQEILQNRSDPVLHELLAQAANQSGDDVRATSASAEAAYWRGEIYAAIIQLQRLSEREDLDYYQRARVTARLSEIRLEFEQLVRLGYINSTTSPGP